MSLKRIPARFAGKCGHCGEKFPRFEQIAYDKARTKAYPVAHAACVSVGEELAAGAAPATYQSVGPTHAEPEHTEPEHTEPEPAPVVVSSKADDLVRILREVAGGAVDAATVRDIVRKEIGKLAKTVTVEVRQPSGEVVSVPNAHKHFPYLIALMGGKEQVWMVGPKGTGKSHTVHLAARALGVPDEKFYPISVGPQKIESDFLGFPLPTGKVFRTAFREWYEHGGILCLDEADAGSPDVLTVLNAAFSNGWCMFPDGLVKRHPDAVCVACANTDGTGRTEAYQGRQAQDGAVLDRFFFLDWPLDESVEDSLCADKEWLSYVRRARAALADVQTEVGMRASMMGARALALGLPHGIVARGTIDKGLSPEAREALRAVKK